MWWLIIPAALALFIIVLLLRAAAFKPKDEKKPEITPAEFDRDALVAHLKEMVRCRTVSNYDWSLVDEAEFEKFRNLLVKLYPALHAKLGAPERIGQSGILYKWKGVSDENPSVLMAHYDVVPANEEAWDKPAFEGITEDGVLWGRGTLDTKITLLGAMEAAEKLIGEGFTPANDVYLAFAGDEEVAGPSQPAIVSELEKRGVSPHLVVDEGGAVVEGVFPGVSAPCALIGIAEKGMMDLSLSVDSKGGHASAPPVHTPVGVLAQAVVNIENKPFKSILSKPVAEMFDTLGRHSTFVYRLIFSNLWCFSGVLDALCKKNGGELNALMRTTAAFTQMEGSKATNVLPPSAKVGANLRIMGGDTMESAIDYMKKTAANDDIKFTKIMGMNPSICSETDCDSYEKVKNAVMQTWPEALVSPYLMIACSDSRHYCRISKYVYRFSAMALSSDERGRIHGNNERVPLETIQKAAEFYLRLVRQC